MFSSLIKDFVEKQAKDAISKQLGIDEKVFKDLDTDMIGSMIGGLSANAKKGGAGGILSALDKDHDGSILDDISKLAQNPSQEGKGILKHLRGSKRSSIEAYLAKKYNLSPQMVGMAGEMLAPIVMAQLGKQQKSFNMNAEQLTDFLQNEEQLIKDSPDNNTNPLLSFLDKDGDGDVDAMDLLAQI